MRLETVIKKEHFEMHEGKKIKVIDELEPIKIILDYPDDC